MTNSKRYVRVRLEINRGQFAALFVALLLLASPQLLESESLVLSTNYPSPAGIDRNLTTTSGTTLARDRDSVGIGTSSPAPSSILDVFSNNRGVLLPRLTTAQRNAISAPAVGLFIYNLNSQGFNYWDGAQWRDIAPPRTWAPLAIFLGELPYGPGPVAYGLPPAVPADAREVLVYVAFRKGNNPRRGAQLPREYRIYTQEGPVQYVQKLQAFWTHSDWWLFNSDNFWLPVTPDRKVYASLDAVITGNVYGKIELLGYR